MNFLLNPYHIDSCFGVLSVLGVRVACAGRQRAGECGRVRAGGARVGGRAPEGAEMRRGFLLDPPVVYSRVRASAGRAVACFVLIRAHYPRRRRGILDEKSSNNNNKQQANRVWTCLFLPFVSGRAYLCHTGGPTKILCKIFQKKIHRFRCFIVPKNRKNLEKILKKILVGWSGFFFGKFC